MPKLAIKYNINRFYFEHKDWGRFLFLKANLRDVKGKEWSHKDLLANFVPSADNKRGLSKCKCWIRYKLKLHTAFFGRAVHNIISLFLLLKVLLWRPSYSNYTRFSTIPWRDSFLFYEKNASTWLPNSNRKISHH